MQPGDDDDDNDEGGEGREGGGSWLVGSRVQGSESSSTFSCFCLCRMEGRKEKRKLLVVDCFCVALVLGRLQCFLSLPYEIIWQ